MHSKFLIFFKQYPPYIIDLISYEGIRNLLITSSVILIFLIIGRYISNTRKYLLAKTVSLITIFFTITNHVIDLNNGNWEIQEDLPLHLCSVSNLIVCFILFIPRNQKLFEFLFYCGFWGGLMAILTAQINDYDGSYFKYIQYYQSHGTIIMIPLFMLLHLDYKLSKFSWFKVLITLNIIMLIIMPLNFLIGSNYMYLSEAPNIKNPLVFGEWPFYILNWEFFILVLFFLTFKCFQLIKRK
tara:strand:- start:2412 stop:3134 length:723 start_codon:yes stop_codon:yes gene_type:complete